MIEARGLSGSWNATAWLASSPTRDTLDRRVHTAGAWCVAAGLVGVVQAVIPFAWSPQVTDERFSFPFTSAGFIAAQATFFLQHIPLVVAVSSLLLVPAVRASVTARTAVVAAAIGLALLTVAEIVAMLAHDANLQSPRGDLVKNMYGPPVILIGLGLTVAGAVLLRRGSGGWVGAGWLPLLLLVMGVYVFFPLSPAIMGSFVAGRLAIGGWMVLFAVFGFGLTRLRNA